MDILSMFLLLIIIIIGFIIIIKYKETLKRYTKKVFQIFSPMKAKIFETILGDIFKKEAESEKLENKPLGLITPKPLLKRVIFLTIIVSGVLIGLGGCLAYLLTGKVVFSIGTTLLIIGLLWKFISSLKNDDCFTNISKAHGGLITVLKERVCQKFPYTLPTGEAKAIKRGWETGEGDIFTLPKFFKGLIDVIPMNKEQQTFEIPPITQLAKDGEISFEITITGQVANLHQAIEIIGENLDMEKMKTMIREHMESLTQSFITSRTIDKARSEKGELSKNILEELTRYEPFWGFNFYSVLVKDPKMSPEIKKALESVKEHRLKASAITIFFKKMSEIPVFKKVAEIDPVLSAKMQIGMSQPGAFKTQSFDIAGGTPSGIVNAITAKFLSDTEQKGGK